jgi:trans-aconitate 2-methyltransferase
MSVAIAKPAKWNAADYAANSSAQHAWARELIAKLQLRGDERVLDVGCGDGKVTTEIARAVPRGAVVGVDASAEMIAFARKTFPAKKYPNLTFQICDAREISPMKRPLALPSPPPGERVASGQVRGLSGSNREILPPLGRGEGAVRAFFDVVFSSSVLHWVDDHPAFLRGAAAVLKPGGRLQVSCGGKGNAQDVYLALRPELRRKRWAPYFRRMPKPYFFYAPEDYQKWLPNSGFIARHIGLAPKDAVYDGPDKFAAWFRTTWLPYTQRVPEKQREEFIAAVTDRYLAKHPLDAKEKVHVRMVRLEIDAVRE